MIAGCWLGSAYVLVVHGDRAAAEKPEQIPAELIVTEPSAAKTPPSAADAVNRRIDWELTKVLVEMDIRNPSPEHEAFLSAYDCTQKRCEKGEQ